MWPVTLQKLLRTDPKNVTKSPVLDTTAEALCLRLNKSRVVLVTQGELAQCKAGGFNVVADGVLIWTKS